MPQSRAERLGVVQDLARDRDERALRDVLACQERISSLTAALESLHRLLHDYNARLRKRGEEGMDTRRWLEYRRFLGHLVEAIDRQKAAVDNAQAELEQKRQIWLDARRNREALERLSERLEQVERQQQQRQDQAEMDERSARSSRRTRTHS